MTGAAIDLDAVRAARCALDAIVSAHPELTQPAARDRLAAALRKEHAPMSKRLDPNASGASTTVGVRLSPDLLAHVDDEVARLSALVPSASFGRSEAVRAMILRAVEVGPSQGGAVRTPARGGPAAASSARAGEGIITAPVRAAEVDEVDEVDETPDHLARAQRAPTNVRTPARGGPAAASSARAQQLELVAPASPVALHTTANGASVATHTGNDNAVAPAAPKPKRKMPHGVRDDGSVVDLDQLRARLEAAITAGQSGRSVARVAELNDSGIVQWRNGTKGLGASSSVKLDAALRKLGF